MKLLFKSAAIVICSLIVTDLSFSQATEDTNSQVKRVDGLKLTHASSLAFAETEAEVDDEALLKLIRVRLPNHYGKLGLSEKQKEEIYQVQRKYKLELMKLETKMKKLKSSRDEKLKTTLTPEQRTRLLEILQGKLKR